jgi:hypothetical protein
VICEKALLIWKGIEKGGNSANELIAQLTNYSIKNEPYDYEFVSGIHTVKSWWLMYKQKKIIFNNLLY